VRNLGAIDKHLRSRKNTGAVLGDSNKPTKAELAMCCCIPPYHDVPPGPTKAASNNHLVRQIWVSLVGGVALLSLSLAGAIWLVSLA
jgi:hypothetical protein